MKKLLNSATYEDLSDCCILFKEDLIKYKDSFDQKDSIIYCKTDYISDLFIHLKSSNKNHVLITHHSDYPIDIFRYNLKPPCIKKWFAINAQYDNINLIAIPLGTKTPFGRAHHESQFEIEWLEEESEKLKNKEKIKDIVYCNWGNTNSDRNNVIKKLEKNIKFKWISGLSFHEYCNDMSNYQFVISPPGNGIDNHRTWESLYLGCFPIVIKNKMYDEWAELPIIQVKDYLEVNAEMLLNSINKQYNYEKLFTNYWKEKIKDERNFR